jgi:hypothetical protein
MLALISHACFARSGWSEGEDTNAPVVEREKGFIDRVEIERFLTLSDEP